MSPPPVPAGTPPPAVAGYGSSLCAAPVLPRRPAALHSISIPHFPAECNPFRQKSAAISVYRPACPEKARLRGHSGKIGPIPRFPDNKSPFPPCFVAPDMIECWQRQRTGGNRMKSGIGEFLSILRKPKGLTQQEVADALGVSNKTVSSWETGASCPDIGMLPAIAELFGVTCDELLRGERLPAAEPGARTEEKREKALARMLARLKNAAAISCRVSAGAVCRRARCYAAHRQRRLGEPDRLLCRAALCARRGVCQPHPLQIPAVSADPGRL